MRYKITFVALIALLASFAASCSSSSAPATLSGLKFGRNTTAEPAVTEFNTGETIYANVSVSNAPAGNHKIKWRIVFDDVPGKAKGEQLGSNSSEFEGSKQLWQAFGSPYPGRYVVEAILTDMSDKQIAIQSGTINIVGEPVQDSPDVMQRPAKK